MCVSISFKVNGYISMFFCHFTKGEQFSFNLNIKKMHKSEYSCNFTLCEIVGKFWKNMLPSNFINYIEDAESILISVTSECWNFLSECL